MNIWNYCNIREGWRGILDWLRFLPRAIKYAYQRAVRGYCDADTWCAGENITQYACNLIDAFCERCDSYPDSDFASYEEWMDYLHDIWVDLDYSLKDPDDLNEYAIPYLLLEHEHYKDYTPEEKAIWEAYVKRTKEIYAEQESRRADAFTRLGLYANALIW